MTQARDKANIPVLNFASKGIDDNADATAITINSSEQIGIGTASPSTKLTIVEGGEPPASGMLLLQANSSSRQLRIQPPTNSDNGFIDFRGGNLTFLDDGTEVARFQSGGKLGIGTSSPQAITEIAGGTGDIKVLRLRTGDSTAANNSGIDFNVLSSATQGNRSAVITLDADGANATGSDYLQFVKTGGSNQKIFFPSNDLIFEGSSEHLRIKADGKVGIGETAPLTKLHVKTADSGVTPFANADEMLVEGSTHSGITIGSGTSGTGNIYFGDSADNDVGSITYDHSADRLDFRTNTQSGFFMQTMTGVTITSSYANMLSVPFGGYLIEIGSSANNASREVWLVLRNGAAYSAATTRLLQRTGNDGPRTYNIRVPADGILEAKLDSGSTITDAKISLFKFGM